MFNASLSAGFAATRPASSATYSMYGMSVTKLLRGLGANGATFKQARAILLANGLGRVADATVRTQLYQGRKGRGRLPSFTEEQVADMLNIMGIETDAEEIDEENEEAEEEEETEEAE